MKNEFPLYCKSLLNILKFKMTTIKITCLTCGNSKEVECIDKTNRYCEKCHPVVIETSATTYVDILKSFKEKSVFHSRFTLVSDDEFTIIKNKIFSATALSEVFRILLGSYTDTLKIILLTHKQYHEICDIVWKLNIKYDNREIKNNSDFFVLLHDCLYEPEEDIELWNNCSYDCMISPCDMMNDHYDIDVHTRWFSRFVHPIIGNLFGECSICLEDITNESGSCVCGNCFHFYHVKCLNDYIRNNGHQCPTCRCEMKSQIILNSTLLYNKNKVFMYHVGGAVPIQKFT